VGRQHRHNNVFYVLGREGIARQRCFDPDCKFFTGDGVSVNGVEEMEMMVIGLDDMIGLDIVANPELWP
jgi:hypothetical protein